MGWKIEFTRTAEQDLERLDLQIQRRVIRFLRSRVAGTDDPRCLGKALASCYAGRWRYLVGDIRLICQIEDVRLLILVLKIGHRRDVYR